MKRHNSFMKLQCLDCFALFKRKRPPWPTSCPECKHVGAIAERGWTNDEWLEHAGNRKPKERAM